MNPEFDYSKLTYDDRVEIHNALAVTTLKHIERAGGLFIALEYVPEPTEKKPQGQPSQLLETVELPPTESTFEENRFFADTANPRLAPFIRERLGKETKFLNEARQALRDGNHLTKSPAHIKIDDIAYSQAAWVEMSEMEDWPDRNGLIVARGVTTIGAFGMVAAEVMQKAGHVFLSFPRTKTMEGVLINPKLIDANNLTMRKSVSDWFKNPSPSTEPETSSKVLHVAQEGRTADVKYGDNHKPDRIQLGRINNASLRFMPGLVAPEVIWDSDEPVYEIGEITTVRTRADIERVQDWQRRRLAHIHGLPDEAVTIETKEAA